MSPGSEPGVLPPVPEQGVVAGHFDLGVAGVDSSGQYQEQVGGGGADGDVGLTVPVFPQRAVRRRADQPLADVAEAVVGGVEVQRPDRCPRARPAQARA